MDYVLEMFCFQIRFVQFRRIKIDLIMKIILQRKRQTIELFFLLKCELMFEFVLEVLHRSIDWKIVISVDFHRDFAIDYSNRSDHVQVRRDLLYSSKHFSISIFSFSMYNIVAYKIRVRFHSFPVRHLSNVDSTCPSLSAIVLHEAILRLILARKPIPPNCLLCNRLICLTWDASTWDLCKELSNWLITEFMSSFILFVSFVLMMKISEVEECQTRKWEENLFHKSPKVRKTRARELLWRTKKLLWWFIERTRSIIWIGLKCRW